MEGKKMGIVNFDALIQNRKRVAVARDVIAKLDDKKIQAEHDGYVYLSDDIVCPKFDDVCRAIKSGRRCHVCVMGAALISALDVQGFLENCDDAPSIVKDEDGDTISLDSFYNIKEVLSDIFDRGTLGLMEAAYEKGALGNHCVDAPNYDAENRAELFGRQYDYPEDRMRAIMQHIIDNDGEWKV